MTSNLILPHGAERIVLMIVAARRLFGIAVAAQIGGDDGEVLRQLRREFLPRQMAERIAVHEQEAAGLCRL